MALSCASIFACSFSPLRSGALATPVRFIWLQTSSSEVGEGDYGDAELLSKAKVTAPSRLQDARIIRVRPGRVRLLAPSELHLDWAPSAEARVTVWGFRII